MIFSELRSYAEDKLGPGSWNAVLKRAGLEQSVYFPIQEYPDCEASALIAAVSTATRRNLSLVLEDFGEFIAPTLMKRTVIYSCPSGRPSTLSIIRKGPFIRLYG